MRNISLILSLTLALSGCAGAWKSTKSLFGPRPQQIIAPASVQPTLPSAPQTSLQSLTSGGRTAAALDTTSAAQKAAATAAPAQLVNGSNVLGKVSVAMGSPAQQGLWLKSSLVKAPAKGRAVLASGQGVLVDLLPGTGGATLSLSAYRALGLKLTDLPQVQVIALP